MINKSIADNADLSVGDIDFVARAEQGKEVEELTKKEIYKAIREKVPIDQVKETGANASYKNIVGSEQPEIEDEETKLAQPSLDENTKKGLSQMMEELVGSRAAYIVDRNGNILTKVPVAELGAMLHEYRGVDYLLVDSKITQPLADIALQSRVKYLIGMDTSVDIKGGNVKILTGRDLK